MVTYCSIDDKMFVNLEMLLLLDLQTALPVPIDHFEVAAQVEAKLYIFGQTF